MSKDERTLWEEAYAEQLGAISAMLERLGFALDEEQPHMGGERYLMQAVTTASGKKFILLGNEARTGRRVVIKVTSDPAGKRELAHERLCRRVLADIGFAYTAFETPEEILFTEAHGYTIAIQAFIEQERSFMERPIEDQFAIALRSFKAQEGAHAATYGHIRLIERTFGRRTVREYLKAFDLFRRDVEGKFPDYRELSALLAKAASFLSEHSRTVEQYEDFLTHTDFIPHNFRIAEDKLYLLDHSSLRFGNKYEGWARFVNFMELYNPPLAQALVAYVRDNRTSGESLSLKLMRVYRLGEILWYYAHTLDRSDGDLKELNLARIGWWRHVLERILNGESPNGSVRREYIELRDRLRSPEEKKRQQGLH
ncbi:MAG: hypothetical protein QOE22_549 [Candidatus Parcubacteria bacterium]|jgi:hypothetical protein|nr:hypothetical protein [Candidatus Parcubacteria bacterium]